MLWLASIGSAYEFSNILILFAIFTSSTLDVYPCGFIYSSFLIKPSRVEYYSLLNVVIERSVRDCRLVFLLSLIRSVTKGANNSNFSSQTLLLFDRIGILCLSLVPSSKPPLSVCGSNICVESVFLPTGDLFTSRDKLDAWLLNVDLLQTWRKQSPCGCYILSSTNNPR